MLIKNFFIFFSNQPKTDPPNPRNKKLTWYGLTIIVITKYCDLIGHSEAQDCGKRSEIVDLQLTNQIPDLLYPTIPYNTLQYLHYRIVVTNTVIQLVTQRPEAMASEMK